MMVARRTPGAGVRQPSQKWPFGLPEQFVLVDGWSLVAGSLAELRGIGGRFASALARPPGCFALAVGIELLVGQHADQDDGSHHREVE